MALASNVGENPHQSEHFRRRRQRRRMPSIMHVNCSAGGLVEMGKRAQALPFLAAIAVFVAMQPRAAKPIDKDHCLPALEAG